MIAIIAGEILHSHHLLTWVMYPSTCTFLALSNITIFYEIIKKSVLVTAELCSLYTVHQVQCVIGSFFIRKGWLRTDQQLIYASK